MTADEPRPGDAGWRGSPTPEGHQRPTSRRRRSMEDSGGLSVSDLVAQHSRADISPVQPGPPSLPLPPVSAPSGPRGGTGRRHEMPPQPAQPPRTGGAAAAPRSHRAAGAAQPSRVPPPQHNRVAGQGVPTGSGPRSGLDLSASRQQPMTAEGPRRGARPARVQQPGPARVAGQPPATPPRPGPANPVSGRHATTPPPGRGRPSRSGP